MRGCSVISLSGSPPRQYPSPRVLRSSPSPPPCSASSSSFSYLLFTSPSKRFRAFSSSSHCPSDASPCSSHTSTCSPAHRRIFTIPAATVPRGVRTPQYKQHMQMYTQRTLVSSRRFDRKDTISLQKRKSTHRTCPLTSLTCKSLSLSSSLSPAIYPCPSSSSAYLHPHGTLIIHTPLPVDKNRLSPFELPLLSAFPSVVCRSLRTQASLSSPCRQQQRVRSSTIAGHRYASPLAKHPSSSSPLLSPSSFFLSSIPLLPFSSFFLTPPLSTTSFFRFSPFVSFTSSSSSKSDTPSPSQDQQHASSSSSTPFSPRSYKMELLSRQWPFMKAEMVRFFETQNEIPFDRISKQHPAAVSSPFHSPHSSSRSRNKDRRGEQEREEEEGFSHPNHWGEDEKEKMNMKDTKASFIENVVGTKRSAYESSGNILFGREGRGSSAVDLKCKEWERFVRKEDIQREGYVPCIVEKYGIERRLAIRRDLLESIAFDEEHGHLSYLFQARLFRLHVGMWIEECLPTYVQADAVAKRLYFVKFQRHVPGKITEVDVPTTMVGLLACPAYQRGYHVELVMPTIRCQCVGEDLPSPFYVDVSKLHYQPPYKAITLRDLEGLLPRDGCTRFHPAYNLDTQEVAWTYEVGTLPEAPLPEDYVDPNFINRKQQKMDVMFHKHFPN
ncbi:ribosomal l25 family protein [Cystoisospora suis]|uniref:Ribosomal l25 family protein n=1 Tax=Cystoisospora suis TaxID=483139 RepID=A0A2C6L519_9APIC|nr:ribosomal l25 family protein [Cystoisospora suis]